MVKLVDDEKLQRLVRIGRERGAVTIDDLRAALPVDLMTPAELAEAVERLEDAGVPVELEGWLSRPAPGGAESPIAGAATPAAPEDATPSTRAELRAPAPPSRAPESTAAPAARSRPSMALGIAIVVLLVVVAILLLLSVA